ncbi:hypothetical protein ACFL1A_00080 [Patescibacteria group bacterium]
MKMNNRLFKDPLLIILFVVSLFPLLGLLPSGIPNGHDTPDHVARIANFYQSLSEGNIVPRWAGNLNWGYGHPILMFLYPLPSYLSSFIHFLGINLVDSVKAVFAIGFVASIFSMYFWIRYSWGSLAGFISALLYGFSSYRFVDLYVRGALGEHIAFVFPPLILLFMDRLSAEPKRNSYINKLGISLSITGLILSHNAVSLMFLPIIFANFIYLYIYKAKAKKLFTVSTVIYISLGFMLSAFFWVPALFEGKYTLRDIVTQNEIKDRFVPLIWFFKSNWIYGGGNEFSKEIGVFQWLGMITSTYLLFKTKNKSLKTLLIGLTTIFIVSISLMLQMSGAIWNAIGILQKFQFPWRLLTVSVFSISVLGGIAISTLINQLNIKLFKSKYIKIIFIFIITIFLLSSTWYMWKPIGYSTRPDIYYKDIYDSTTDTGESSPIWSVRFMENRPKAYIEVIEGKGNIENIARNTTFREYDIEAYTKLYVVENTLYFPGWKVFIDGVEESDIEFQNPNYRGLITFKVPEGLHKVSVQFSETKLRLMANYLSIFAVIIVVMLKILHIWKKR